MKMTRAGTFDCLNLIKSWVLENMAEKVLRMGFDAIVMCLQQGVPMYQRYNLFYAGVIAMLMKYC